MNLKLITVALAASLFSLNTSAAQKVVCDPPQEQGSVGGSIIGGIAGGLLGHTIGKGSGNVLATGAGAITGAIVGNKLGGSQGNQNCHNVEEVSGTPTQINTCSGTWVATGNGGGEVHYQIEIMSPSSTSAMFEMNVTPLDGNGRIDNLFGFGNATGVYQGGNFIQWGLNPYYGSIPRGVTLHIVATEGSPGGRFIKGQEFVLDSSKNGDPQIHCAF